jgi:hypothetical protein
MNFFGTWFIYTIGFLLYGMIFIAAVFTDEADANKMKVWRGVVAAVIAAGLMASTSAGTN